MEHRDINNPYSTFNFIGEYFKLRTYAHQPVWCSYSLHQLKELWDESGGIITDSSDNIIFIKIQREFI
jgi:hypothetical protein